MRWLALILLLLNGIYFIWLQQQADVNVPRVARVSGALKTIDLWQQPEQKLVEAIVQAPVAELSPAVCWQIGPFVEEISVKQVTGRFEERGLEAEFVTEQVDDRVDYWVYVPSLGSYKEALAMLRKMQADGVDSFVVGSGKSKNAISLGVFRDQTRAEKLLSLRREQGYQAEIQRNISQKVIHWLLFSEEDSGVLDDELWSVIIAGNKGIKKLKKNCQTIASMK